MKPCAGGLAPILCLALALGGCFYPPNAKPFEANRNRIRLEVPYDVALDAVNSVIVENHYKVRAQDPNHGIIEAQGTSFTTHDADCGQVHTLGGATDVEPTDESSAVYNFHLAADGPEASIVGVEATFVAPLRVPFHRPTDVECISRGTDEARLLKEVSAQASAARRPAPTPPPSR